MDKVDTAFLRSRGPGAGLNARNESSSAEDLNINQRVAQFLMMLRQLDESSGGLESIPKEQLGELVSSALGLCGFVDPQDSREVIVAVLEAMEVDPGPQARLSAAAPSPPH